MPNQRHLFAQFPALARTQRWVCLADLPTPIHEFPALAAELGIARLYIKRDDLSAPIYGGNKVRKLEFLLGAALANGAREVMTFGCAGSNHATATAIYAHQLGLKSISMLLPQPNAASVRRNLLMSYQHDAELHYYSTSKTLAAGVKNILRKRTPEIIPAGGSSPLGVIGYVNAAFELADQIASGTLAMPDMIYVAGGTTGTAAGLILGLKAAHLEIPVIIIRVTAEKFVNTARIRDLLQQTAQLLRDKDASFPKLAFDDSMIRLRHEFYGQQYALYTPESVAAVKLLQDKAGVKLEGTYTGKTFAAVIADARGSRLRDKSVLFWNTYNSRDFSEQIAGIDYHQLPKSLHRYFKEDVQPLDK